MTSQEQLSCNAKTVFNAFCGNQTQMMAALVAVFAQIAGISVNCATLQTLAAQYNCLPRQAQLPALIYLASQIVAAQIVPAGSGFAFQGIGNPSFTPSQPVAFYVDNTIPAQPAFWNWNGTSWNLFIAS